MKRVAAWVLSAHFVAAACAAETSCPPPPVPAGARVAAVAKDLVLDGARTRIARIEAAGAADDVLAFYRERFGARHVEMRVPGARTIAAEQDGCFVTVRVPPEAAGRTRATVMSTRIERRRQRSRAELDTESLLPIASSVLQTQESNDDGKPTLLLVATTTEGWVASRSALQASFEARGFHVLHVEESLRDGHPFVALGMATGAEDAALTIADRGAYRLLVVQRSRSAQ